MEKNIMGSFVVGTFTRSEKDYDRRDFKIDDLFWSDYSIDNLPEEFSWRWCVGKTSYQNGRWSCTSLWGTHSMQIQNITELISSIPDQSRNIYDRIEDWDNIIDLKREDLRVKMGHILNDKTDSWDFVENMLKTLKDKWIEWIDINKKPKIYFSDGFAFANTPSTESGIPWLKLNITKSPLVFAIRGNSKTRQEMQAWRVLTIVYPKDQTGGHCVAVDGYDNADCHFLNSWRVTQADDRICAFKIDWQTFKAMVKAKMINRRYWKIFDKKDTDVDLELYRRKQEAIVTIKQCRKMYEKGDLADKKKFEEWKLGSYLKDKYKITEEDLSFNY